MRVGEHIKELPIHELDPYTLQDIRAFNKVCREARTLAEQCSPDVFDAVVKMEKWRKEIINTLKQLAKEKKVERDVMRSVVRYINTEFDMTLSNVKAYFEGACLR